MLSVIFTTFLLVLGTMMFVGLGKFGVNLKHRFGKLRPYYKFRPPMKFVIEKHTLHFHLFDVVQTPFMHDKMNFELLLTRLNMAGWLFDLFGSYFFFFFSDSYIPSKLITYKLMFL